MGCFDFITKVFVIGLLITSLGLQSCSSNEEKEADSAENVSPESDLTNAASFHEKDLVYAWVDKLSVRDTPNLKGKIIASLNSKDALEVTGEQSEQTEIIVLRGMVYNEPWVNVKLPDGSNGWVFGGAVKHKDEDKGNELITNQKFDFPHFGKYDLTKWEKQASNDESGGDAEIETTVYKKGNQILEVSVADVGEYGYSRYYTLKDGKGKVLKERTFSFSADIKEMSETVKDFTTSTLYERKQKIAVHYSQLNAKPVMVNRPWSESELPEDAVDALPAGFELIASSNDFLKKLDDDGCSCSFRTHPNDYKTVIFRGNYEDPPKAKAVIQLNGDLIVLNRAKPKNPDSKQGNVFYYFYNDKYDLNLTLVEEGRDDGGGIQYTGTMKLTTKDGTEISHINTFGGCGC